MRHKNSLRRFLATTLVAVAAALGVAMAPAGAHAEISPEAITVGRPAFLTLTAANEKSANLTRLAVTAPAGLAFGTATRQPQGWTASASPSEITWSGGTLGPNAFDQWGFEVAGATQPGSVLYKVTSSFADGSAETREVGITVLSGGDDPVVGTATPSAGGAPEATSILPGSGDTEAVPTIPVAKPTSGEATAATALVFSIVAGLLGGAALIAALRKRPGTSTLTPDQKAPTR